MNGASDSLANWLKREITSVLEKKIQPAPFIIWCDPAREWRDILLTLSAGGDFELWAGEEHELQLRERFFNSTRKPGVIWIPKNPDDLSYSKAFACDAEKIISFSIPEALIEYGLQISSEDIEQFRDLLKSHVKEWLDRPKSGWKELNLVKIKETLIDDEHFLNILCSTYREPQLSMGKEQFSVFRRRAVEDFGLPETVESGLKKWRINALACILVTEAAELYPDNPPGDHENIIPPGSKRKHALKLLSRMKKNIDYLDAFELLVQLADGKTPLQFWAKSFTELPKPVSSFIAEKMFFKSEVERISCIGRPAELSNYLAINLALYQAHAKSFWGKQAQKRIAWDKIILLAESASLIRQASGVQRSWTALEDAVSWYTSEGWKVDHTGERILSEDTELPDDLLAVRAMLRRAYQRILDVTNIKLSELLYQAGSKIDLNYSGDIISDLVKNASTRNPVALLVLDAFRFDLGIRLSGLINDGEPVKRSTVDAARSPLPSITPIGMALCLPGMQDEIKIKVSASTKPEFSITVEGYKGNLAVASDRRRWLKNHYKLKDTAFLTVSEILAASSADFVKSKERGKLLFIFGSEFDTEGHSGQLQIKGGDFQLDRYHKAIRLLREGGYSTIVVVTDHGFFHWAPAADEVEPKPEGEILWDSRRAVIGRKLKSSTSLKFELHGSDIECMVPRSTNAYKTYGKIGFFHGGATLQELIIPVIVARWPQKTQKVKAVIKPIEHITTLAPRIEIEPGQSGLFDATDQELTGRRVIVKVVQPESGRLIFISEESVAIEPGGDKQAVTLAFKNEAKFGEKLEIRLLDDDDEETLETRPVIFRVEADESDWDY